MWLVEALMAARDRKAVQEAKEFMIAETQAHPKKWHGWTTEQWMVVYARKKLKEKEVKKR